MQHIVLMQKQSSDLNQLALFAEVVSQGSFTRAAERLGLSKSFVSKRVSQLEADLGVVLLRRTTRSLALTEEGSRFVDVCRRVVDLADQGVRWMRSRGQQAAGSLRISAPITYGQLFLPALLQDFSQRYPAVELDLVLENRAIDLMTENFDLAFRITESPPTSLGLTPLGMMEDVVCAAPTFLERYPRPNRPGELSGLPCLLYLNPERQTRWTFRKHRRVEVIEVDGPTAYSHHGALLGPLFAGHGVAKLPEYYVASALSDGRLVRLLPDYHCRTLPIYLVHHPLETQPARVREFVRFAQARLH